MNITPHALLTNELESPMNVEGPPRFSWWLRGEGAQTAWQLLVIDDVTGAAVWDSGKIPSAEQSQVKYAGPALAPACAYQWRVRVWGEADTASEYSKPASFATGLADGDWQADWLQLAEPPKKRSFYWYARTQRPLPSGTMPGGKAPVRALAWFCMQHEYDLYVNGLLLGRGQCFDYQGEQRYQGWDITQAVRGSGDAVTLALHCRWFGAGQGRDAHVQGLLGHAVIYFDDGTKQVVVTDKTWRTSAGTPLMPTSWLRNNEGDTVERCDARRERPGWAAPDHDTSDWAPPRVLGPHPNETFPRLTAELGHVGGETVRPVSVKRLKNGNTLADFGRVIPARIQIAFANGRAGRKLRLRTGYERTRAGRVNTRRRAAQDTNMRYIYIMKNGPAAYESWEHLGFRYLEIPKKAGQIDDIRAVLFHAEVPNGRDSTLETSNEMLNKVFELMKRSALYGTQNTFVDTPTREKGQFLHDAINISAATTTAWYERETTRKGIEQFLASADRHWSSGNDIGRYNAVYPNGEGKRDIPDFTLNLPLWVWRYYTQTGDAQLLARAYPHMRNTADYASRHIPNEGPLAGLVVKLSGGGNGKYKYGNIDWPPVGRFGYDVKAHARTTVNALSVQLFDVLALSARALGKEAAEIGEYETRASDLRKNMNEKLITPAGLYCDGLDASGRQSAHLGQHSTSYALAFGIAPENLREPMAGYIASLGMRQGPMTAAFLAEALFKSGRAAAALRLLTNTEDHGWAHLIEHHDATFTWEQWTVGQHQSQSHAWGAAALAQLLEYIAGVKVTGPGAAAIVVNPLTAGLLDHVNARVVTERGPVLVSYTGQGRGYTLQIQLPPNVRAEVVLPELEGGRFAEEDLGNGIKKYIFIEE